MTQLLKYADDNLDIFAKNLDKVLEELEGKMVKVLRQSTLLVGDAYDASLFLNARPEMLQALRDAGYDQLAESHIAKYEGVPEMVKREFSGRLLPEPKFSALHVEDFKELAGADLEMFSIIGEKAMNDLRMGLYKSALVRAPFNELVEQIRAATVGVDKRGSSLKRYAYTHANTALLNFEGVALEKAGESIGAKNWELVHPLDSVTRPVCRKALKQKIRSRDAWVAANYFGGTPGGFN